jgi:NAD(P)-dependent dehydrogenase (short-subunit alcohol dehydrogenase family)
VWVNNAMATVFAELADVEPDEFRRATEVTYLGTVWGTMAALRRMLLRDRGCIVQVGSALSYRSIPLQSAYCGAKFAIRGMTDSLRTELIHRRSAVRVVMVQLPAVNTPQFSWCRSKLPRHPQPVPPIYQPEVPAEAVWRASRRSRRERWVATPARAVILASKVVPGLMDRYLGRTGYESQQIADMLVSPDRPDNLFAPVPEKAATHGIFDDRARVRLGPGGAATRPGCTELSGHAVTEARPDRSTAAESAPR